MVTERTNHMGQPCRVTCGAGGESGVHHNNCWTVEELLNEATAPDTAAPLPQWNLPQDAKPHLSGWLSRQPTRAAHHVVYEVRRFGSCTQWDKRLFIVDAFALQDAAIIARGQAHEQGFETRFPLAVVRVEG